jgi:hypothetical protein
MFILVLLAAALLPSFLASAQETVQLDFSIELTNTRLLYNEQVGNNWECVAYVNREAVTMAQEYTVYMDRPRALVLEVVAREIDADPDIGHAKLRVPYRELAAMWDRYMKSGKSSEHEYRVQAHVFENEGKFKGNEAVMDFIFLFRISEEFIR